MQKKLLTLAVAGALAAPGLAQAQVEVYGLLGVTFGKWKYGDGTGGAQPSKSMWDVASNASNIGVRARESLGGGLTGWAQVETNASMERSNNIAHTSNFASRNSAVGLEGSFGNVFAGQWVTPWTDLDALWSVGTVSVWGPSAAIIGRRETTGSAPNPNCANNFSGNGGSPLPAGLATLTTTAQPTCESAEGLGGVGHPFFRRISNSIFYYTPVFAGAQVKLAYQTNQDKSTITVGPGGVADPSMYSASVTWSGMGGRARVGAALDGHKDFTNVGKTDTGWKLSGGFNFGVADIGASYETMTYKTATSDCDAKQYVLAFAIPIGQGAIRGAYAIAKDIEGAYTGAQTTAFTATGSCGAVPTAAAPSNDNGAKQYNIGYDHRLSKRTQVGVGFAKIVNDPGAIFTWSGAPTTQAGQSVNPPAGSDPQSFFVSIIHRF